MAYFKNIEKIKYEGKGSKNPLAFKYYNPEEVIMGKTMKEHLKFSVAYWHTFNADGADPFGDGTIDKSWGESNDPMEHAKRRLEVAFEFFTKLDVPYFAFHDRDIAPEGKTLRETNENLDIIIGLMEEKIKETGVKVLWNTANAFTHPRFVHGAGTSSNADVFAYTAAQIKKGLETAKRLGSESYVFWGGREGYECLLNTDMKFELDNLAKLFKMAVAYADEIGYTGQFLIEPKPKEPTKHQYDFDAQSATAFLQKYDLQDRFKFNIEANHATLAGHTFEHELRYCGDNDMLGSVDANQGDVMLGWDTDEFPTDLHSATLAMYEILKNGGLEKGGLNFDSKLRRSSIDLEDLFLAHIAGMDTFARALRNAAKLIEDKFFENIIDEKYASFKTGIGADIVSGKADIKSLENYILDKEITNKSGKIEFIKNRLNDYIY